ncbi:MAG: BglII/BstYI family type II restriction endonuclease [Rubricella sp.]
MHRRGFDILTKNHAEAILANDFSSETRALVSVLEDFRISVSELIAGGGGEAASTQRLRRSLAALGWPKHEFLVQTIVDGQEREGISHEVDHVLRAKHGTLCLEIEWNNKDPFFDRDLENFQRLHSIGATSVGIIITRGQSLQDSFFNRIRDRLILDGIEGEKDLKIYGVEERTAAQRRAVDKLVQRGVPFPEAFARNFVSSKYGQATTHWRKLEARVTRGVGNPCPLLLIGLPKEILVD